MPQAHLDNVKIVIQRGDHGVPIKIMVFNEDRKSKTINLEETSPKDWQSTTVFTHLVWSAE